MAIDANEISEDALNKAQVGVQKYSRVSFLGNMVLLSVRVPSKDGNSETLSSTFSILDACNIPVSLISYAANEPAVYCVISQKDVFQAKETLCSNFAQQG
ncbi:hypothetical protein BDV25DRAFT_137802 [Aspergillus avenaceus]|uniref:aspartate kinase n=1 Tax=Aspergillus avenaceus TaxID=36643 RepID=A0A5N6U1T1_ASPAV|nr:hypothetical protein BDV25DRAFT_137802 [Aspergillus avenaceus]